MRDRISSRDVRSLAVVLVAAGAVIISAACAQKPDQPTLPQPSPQPNPSLAGTPKQSPAEALAAVLRRPHGSSLREALQWRIDSLVAASNFPGVVLGVSLSDGTTFAVAGGYADTAKNIRMRPDARMLLGSVGKTYFSAVALDLVDDGKLDLDAPISKYLGDEPWFNRIPNANDITVRMLMNHTSGLVRYEFNPKVTAAITADPDKEFTPEERISYILDTAPPFAAGQGWQYSDTNYIVLGMIVEKITDNSYYTLIRRRILNPLSLSNTIPSNNRKLVGVVQGYAGPNNPFGGKDAMWEDGRMIMNPQMEWAGGGFAATAGELAFWARNLYGGTVLSEKMKKELFTTVPAPALGRGVGYGLGVISAPTDLGQSWGHSGFFPGYLTEVRYYPEFDFAVSMLFNTSVARSLGKSPSTLLQDMARTVAMSQKRRGS
jgi:D-alanyl-D-alanine carboxypeptidase